MENQGVNMVSHWVFEILLHKDPAFSQEIANSLDKDTSDIVANYGRLLASCVHLVHAMKAVDFNPLGVEATEVFSEMVSEAVSDLIGYGIQAGYSNDEVTTVFRNLYGPFADTYHLDSSEWEDVLNKTREQFEN